jgi:hypothetical protein
LKKIVKAAGISLVILSSSFMAHSAEAVQKNWLCQHWLPDE